MKYPWQFTSIRLCPQQWGSSASFQRTFFNLEIDLNTVIRLNRHLNLCAHQCLGTTWTMATWGWLITKPRDMAPWLCPQEPPGDSPPGWNLGTTDLVTLTRGPKPALEAATLKTNAENTDANRCQQSRSSGICFLCLPRTKLTPMLSIFFQIQKVIGYRSNPGLCGRVQSHPTLCNPMD